jgi:hypothetical protein
MRKETPMKRRARAGAALLPLCAAALALAGCSKTRVVTQPAPGGGSGMLHVLFDHRGPLMLDGGMYHGTDGAGNAYSVTTLRYFVSNVQVRSTSGVLFGQNAYHYRDAGLPATREYLLSGIPSGTYDALVFTFGLDEQWNVSGNGIGNDPNVAGMEWPPDWGGGWHYMILEGLYDPANAFGYRTHFGRRYIPDAGDPSGQGPDAAPHPHHFNVWLPFPAPVQIAGDMWQTTVRMDLDRWYADPAIDLAALFPNGSGGIMVNLDAQAMLRQNGPGCFSVTQPGPHSH